MRCVVTVVVALTAAVAMADVPKLINFQGRLTDKQTGQRVNGTVDITFRIYDVATGGTPLWEETHTGVQVKDGLYAVVLGSVQPLNLPFDKQYWLGIEVNNDGEMTPRYQMASVPYALRAAYAEDADKLDGHDASDFAAATHTHDWNDITNKPQYYPTEWSQIANKPSTFPPSSHTHDWNDITNKPQYYPTEWNQIANKPSTFPPSSHTHDWNDITNKPSKYPDADKLDGHDSSYFAPASHNHDSRYVNVTGDTMTGDLTISSGNALHFTNGSYSADIWVNSNGYLIMGNTPKGATVKASNRVTLSAGSDCAVHIGGGQIVYINNVGLYVWKDLNVSGTKNFVQPHPKDPEKEIVYACLEGGESGTYCRGVGRLVNGAAVVKLPEHFTLVTAEEGLTAYVTPMGECIGLYVERVNNRELVVREVGGGKSNVNFSWLVMGIRKGYENY
ncbi:MAG: hypothetical protein DRP82_07175, partial [Planctomycetota bacterium]